MGSDQLWRTRVAELVLNLLSGIADRVWLHGAEALAGYGDAVRAYPDALARAVVRRHGQIEFFWRWEMLVHGGNHPGPIHAQFWTVQQHILQMLLAVNRRYPVGYKILHTIVEGCAISPTKLGERFDSISTRPAAMAAAELRSLVRETYDLVENHVPGLEPGEADRWRHYFGYRRPFGEAEPPRP